MNIWEYFKDSRTSQEDTIILTVREHEYDTCSVAWIWQGRVYALPEEIAAMIWKKHIDGEIKRSSEIQYTFTRETAELLKVVVASGGTVVLYDNTKVEDGEV